MANLADARILYLTWARQFDPTAGPFERLSSSMQEAWLLVAAAARMLDSLPEPPASLTPGLLYQATWDPLSSWADVKAPRRPQIVFSFPDEKGVTVIETQRDFLPCFTTVPIPPKEVKRIPGLIYDETPIY